MARFRVEDLLINVVGPGGWCGPALTRCIGVTLPNCGGVTLVGCQAVTLVGCEGQTLVGCGATLCGGNVTVCLGVSRCLGAALIAGCDAGCTLGTCSDACTWCSGECSKKATCEANKTTLVPSREEDSLNWMPSSGSCAACSVKSRPGNAFWQSRRSSPILSRWSTWRSSCPRHSRQSNSKRMLSGTLGLSPPSDSVGTVGSSQVGDWTDRIIRCNPAYRLVDICDLSDVERALLPSSPTGGAPAALLLPRDGSALGTKAICSDARSLLVRADGTRSTRHLLESCRDGTTSDDIATLVMDRILEVETGGVFASGALAQVGLALSDNAGERTGIARKSREALRSASHLDDRDEPGLAAFLYSFGRYPVTPSWRRRLPDVARTRAFLGLDDSPVEALLRRRWDPAAGGRVTDGWFAWRRHNTERRGSAVHQTLREPEHIHTAVGPANHR